MLGHSGRGAGMGDNIISEEAAATVGGDNGPKWENARAAGLRRNHNTRCIADMSFKQGCERAASS